MNRMDRRKGNDDRKHKLRRMIGLYSMIFLFSAFLFALGMLHAIGLIILLIAGIVEHSIFVITFGIIGLGVIAGLSFGSLMSLIAGTAHIINVKKVSPNYKGSYFKKRHERYFRIEETYAKTIDICLRSLDLIEKYTIVSLDRKRGYLEAKTRYTVRSYGELIRFRIFKIDERYNFVIVNSEPLIKWVLLDSGKNLENVIRIERNIIDREKSKVKVFPSDSEIKR